MSVSEKLRTELQQSYYSNHKLIRNYFDLDESLKDFDFIARLYSERPDNTRAVTSIQDWMFINDFIAGYKPNKVIEFGIASGMSTSCLLSSMSYHGLITPNDTQPVIKSYDILEYVHWDTTNELRIGFAIDEICPELKHHVELNFKKTSLDFKNESPSLDTSLKYLAFVDGDHAHPWPLIDVLTLVNKLPSGSWILLQDIGLVERGYQDMIKFNLQNIDWATRGAQLVYEYWPGEKIRGIDGGYNMCGLKIKDNKSEIIEALKFLIKYPFEKPLTNIEESYLNGLLS